MFWNISTRPMVLVKVLHDTALKTANSGYLLVVLLMWRRIISFMRLDCGTNRGLTIRPVMNGSDVVDSLYDRILGRVLAEDLVDLKTGSVLVGSGQMVTEEHAEAIKSSGVDQALIRSALLCEAEKGICAACYGRDSLVVPM